MEAGRSRGGTADTMTDNELMERVRQGDEPAFADLVAGHGPGVSRYLRGIVRDPERARDLTQETFLKVWMNAVQFHPSGSFKAWLYLVARNTAISDIRKQRVREFLGLSPTAADGSALPEPAWDGPAPDREAFNGEIRDLVDRALG